eukprot:g43007.t1
MLTPGHYQLLSEAPGGGTVRRGLRVSLAFLSSVAAALFLRQLFRFDRPEQGKAENKSFRTHGPYYPAEGLSSSFLPGPPSLLQLPPSVLSEINAIFWPGDEGLPPALLPGTHEMAGGRVFGAKTQNKHQQQKTKIDEYITKLAEMTLTENPADHVDGTLLIYKHVSIQERLKLADFIMSYNSLTPYGNKVRRGLAKVVMEDGSWIHAYCYYNQEVPGHTTHTAAAVAVRAGRMGQSGHLLTPDRPYLSFGQGPHRRLITVGIHGDEPCGVLAINQLIQEGYFEKVAQAFPSHDPRAMTVEVVLGNPRAYTLGQRFVSKNLNRIFSEELIAVSKKDGHVYEAERADFIAKRMRETQWLLDVHSTSAPGHAWTLPAANDPSEALSSLLPVYATVKDLAHLLNGGKTIIDLAKEDFILGITVECGEHNAPETVLAAKRVIMTFLAVEPLPDYPDFPSTKLCKSLLPKDYPTERPRVLRALGSVEVWPGFSFLPEGTMPTMFQKVPYGAEVCRDDVHGVIKCKEKHGAIIVMPAHMPHLGEDAFVWAVEED